MIRTFWRWKQVLTIRKWCLGREKRREEGEGGRAAGDLAGGDLWFLLCDGSGLVPQARTRRLTGPCPHLLAVAGQGKIVLGKPCLGARFESVKGYVPGVRPLKPERAGGSGAGAVVRLGQKSSRHAKEGGRRLQHTWTPAQRPS